MGKKLPEMKIIYRYVEPKTEEERAEQQRKLDRIYGPIFDQALAELRREDKNFLR